METQQIPAAKKQPKELSKFNDKRVDNYFWLNERENPEVIDYLEQENKYTEDVLSNVKELREILFEEMTNRVTKTDMSAPLFQNKYWHYTRYEEGKEYPVFCRRKKKMEAEEEIIFDVNSMAGGREFYRLANFEFSPNNKFAAFVTDAVGRKQLTLQFKNMKTGKLLKEKIYPVDESMAWAKDSKTIFYVMKHDSSLRPYRVMKHKLGTPQADDEIVFEEADESFEVSVGKTRTEEFIIISSTSTLTSEQRFISSRTPDAMFRVIQSRIPGVLYEADNYREDFFIRTNYSAENFRLMKTSMSSTGIQNWEEVIPHRENIFLEKAELFKNFLVLEEYLDGLPQINVLKWKGLKSSYLTFDEPAFKVTIGDNPELKTSKLRITYTSLLTPETEIEVDMKTGDRKVLKQKEIQGFIKENYVTERLNIKARDGESIPVSLVYNEGMPKDGNNPLLLYGYGSYGYNVNAEFCTPRLSLLDRGFVFAIAHVRGGQELGRRWYEDGKLLKKKNTFYDFIDCAEFLIEKRYTRKEVLFAEGKSAGGLLMGVVANLRPDLWNGIIAHVPFVDVITTMLDDTLPLTAGEYDEWGNPDNEEFYYYMKSYSPYDNIEKKNYPAILATTALPDSQVQYWEAAKWVAKLREYTTSENPILLHTEMHASHSGKSGRFESMRLFALQYAFMLDRIGFKSEG
jgi:oligopeptidase B